MKIIVLFFVLCGPVMADRYTDTTDKVKVDCASIYTDRSLVISTFGQSQAANHVNERYTPRNAVYNFFNGCYLASDPLLGATGIDGSVWVRLADKILDTYNYDNVILVSSAIAGTSIIQWTAGSDLANYLIFSHIQLLDHGLNLDLQLMIQGSADVLMEKYQYKYFFKNMVWYLRYYYVTAPLYLAQASYCKGNSSLKITDAQYELAEEMGSVFHGPNVDLVTERYDNCHFSGYGADIVADMWMDSLQGFH